MLINKIGMAASLVGLLVALCAGHGVAAVVNMGLVLLNVMCLRGGYR